MKNFFKNTFGLFLLAFLLLGCNSESSVTSSDNESSLLKPGEPRKVFPALSQDEIDGLIHMRIEEKLARDVYTVLGEKWNARVFLNIKLSEQTHMDAVKRLLDRYAITDPLTTDEVGVFPDEHFQTLYNQLVEKGSISLTEALKVGVQIEELDIEDLEYQLTNVVDNPDIIRVYTNLKKGSENHLAAFNRNLNFLQ
jgi:hypothetical protein